MSRDDLVQGRRAYAAAILAGDVDAFEALLRGWAVPRSRLHRETLIALDELPKGPDIAIDDDLALRVELVRGVEPPDDSRRPWLVSAADVLAEPDPGPTPWLVENLIVDAALIAAVGPWKSTKTYALLDVAISVATGQPAFGALVIPKPGPVVYVLEESGRAALRRRLDALCRGRAVPPEHLRELHVSTNARVKLDDPEWQARLIETAQRIGPRLVVFDPLARMKDATRNENEQTAVGAIIDFWRRLRDETEAAVALVHHQGHVGGHMRGSSDLESVWETRLTWARDGATITLTSEHREAESGPELKYRLAWDDVTRTMRLPVVEDDLEQKVRQYLVEHPKASANDVAKAVEGNRQRILEIVRSLREGGSGASEPPGTTRPPIPVPGKG